MSRASKAQTHSPKPERLKVIVVRSWPDFLGRVNRGQYRSWAYRGQADAEWPVESALTRYLRGHGVHLDHWEYQEWRSIEKFQEKAHHFLDHVPGPLEHFRWIALMQHFGAPTRLIDFTWSPYVAAFFALEAATTDAAVWAVNGERIRYTRRVETQSGPVFPDQIDPRIERVLQYQYMRRFDHDNVVLSVDEARQLDAFAHIQLHETRDFAWIGEPGVLNQRLVAQSGTFAVPGVLHRPLEAILADYAAPTRTVAQFVLPVSVREQAMADLRRMNITYATLFPDLGGLARSMGWELESHWQFNPKTAGW